MAPHLHIVGAGLAGLACAVRASQAGVAVTLHEAAAQAGGRCRSYYDEVLDRRIDNGNHLLLSGNDNAMAYAQAIGAGDRFVGPKEAAFPFLDLATGERWTVRLNRGSIPWWMLSGDRRVKGTSLGQYFSVFRVLAASRKATVAECVDTSSALYERFWEPMTVAVLNASPMVAAASLLAPVLTRTFLKGGAHSRPMVAKTGLSDSLIDPALAFLKTQGATVHFNHRLRFVDRGPGRITALDFGGERIALSENEGLVLAVPPTVAAEILPEIAVPEAASPIVNGHFRVDREIVAAQPLPILGLLGGTAQWLFFRDDIVSVTVSAADDLVSAPAEEIAKALWRDVAKAIRTPDAPLPVHRIVKEKRATFAQTPASLDHRPATGTEWANLALAGDWTATGLPATIEGAVASGFAAGDHMAARLPSSAVDPAPASDNSGGLSARLVRAADAA
jgi:squalene-associated FAD-dependent desaturase